MADVERANPFGFIDKRRVQTTADVGISSTLNYASVAGLRARLTAIDSAYFTAARLNQMTRNDMVMAVRQADDAAGI